MKILFIDTMHPYLQSNLQKDGHECIDGHLFSKQEILQIASDLDGIVLRSRITVDKELLDATSKLLFIGRAGAGMESIDVDYAKQRGIECINSPEGNRDAVGEHAIGMLLALFNNLSKADREVRSGNWNREGNRGHELKDKTIGLIGYGNMGNSFAQRLSGFSCTVLAYDKYKTGFSDSFAQEANMEKLFSETDILSLHVPLNAEPDYLVNNSFLQKFRKNIFLVNTARGKCVNTDDLVKNLQNGKVLGACLDVLEYEDNSFEKFKIQNSVFENSPSWKYLVQSDKVILSPHIAGWTFESQERLSRVLYEKIKGFLARKYRI